MSQIYEEIYKKYYLLRNDIDKFCEKLYLEHSSYLQCKKGCDLCCMDYKIFPVEFYSIVEELKNNSFNVSDIEKKEAENNCIYLKNHECLIYNSRPIICRSHGLPLLYTNDEGEWELSACELNFTEFENGFTEENTFPQDKFNSKLFMINKKFIQESKEKKFAEFELISIKEIIKFLV